MSGPTQALVAPLERQVRLLQTLVERSLAPFDAVFDLLEQSGAAMHRQADALSESARAMEQAAELMRVQADCTSGPSAPRVRLPRWRRVSRASAGAIGSCPAGGPWLPRMTHAQAGRTVGSPPELPIEPRSLP